MSKDLIKNTIDQLYHFQDENRIEFASKNYPSKIQTIGVTNPNLKVVLKDLKAQTKGFATSQKIELAKHLVTTDILECQQLAYEFLDKSKDALKALSSQDVKDLCRNLDNWVLVDYYGCLILGYAWREAIVSTDLIKEFYSSEDFWYRRAAIVATVALNQKARGGSGDASRTLEICELAVEDHQDMINKALSWALRELYKVDPEPVVNFLAQNEGSLHSRVVREVNNKIQKGTKN